MLVLSALSIGQATGMNFHLVTTKDGLNDNFITCMIQDKYGYMWFGSLGGLNRYNGSTTKRFTKIPGDSTSIPEGIPWTIASDADGRLFTGFDFGLYEYDFNKDIFIKHDKLKGVYIQKIVAGPDKKLYLLTGAGLLIYQPVSKELTKLSSINKVIKENACNTVRGHGDKLFIGSYNGYIVYNVMTQKTEFIDVKTDKDFHANRIDVDKNGKVWLCDITNLRLIMFDPLAGKAMIVSNDPLAKATGKGAAYNDLVCDNAGNTWVTTSLTGLLKANSSTGSLQYFLDDSVQHGTSYNILTSAYISRDGIVWMGSVNGIIYFDPEDQLFSSLYPLPEGKLNAFGRAMLEDRSGNLWFATSNGISRFDPTTRSYTTWRNEPGKPDQLYYNSVRGIAEDNNGIIWIATGRGINSYTPGQKQLRSYSIADSIPVAFYFSANADSKGRIWFGTKDHDGLYYYTSATGKFSSIKDHPLLKLYAGLGARIVFEDSKKRLWISCNGNGLVMADEATGKTRRWFNNDSTRNTIIGNTVIDIKEDKNGVIWVSTFNGVTGIDLEKEKYEWLDDKTFFNTNYTGPLAIDSLNRLWIGTANGLYVTDERRKAQSFFDESNGLIGSSFTEHSGYVLRNGEIMMPTTKGFVRFKPELFKPQPSSYGFYISWIDLLNKKKYLAPGKEISISLKPNEDFFTIGLEAVNYVNSSQTWYAYKLDGFEDDWHYTQDPKAVYTHVPGGNYTFVYKATSNINNWSIDEKRLKVHIATVFYKTKWFWVSMAMLLAALLIMLYRFRMHKQRQIHTLQSKAQMLEKEKALVMFESLKQQLNPHFLFNSLSSLSGLIEADQQLAGNFLKQMSKIYRYILKSRDSEVVTLKEEIEFVQTYISLQKTRFKNGLQVNVNIDENDLHKKIPPVTLQNLVENSIKHNIIDVDSPLVIDMFTENGYMVVKNNLQKKQVVESSNKQGLSNLRSLYKYLSDKPVIVEENENYFLIWLPLI
jgi:ligand-binding sensor domain-containing protein